MNNDTLDDTDKLVDKIRIKEHNNEDGKRNNAVEDVEGVENRKLMVNLDLDLDPRYFQNDPEYAAKKEALELLDCMTCPADEDDPAYDVEKDIKRDEILLKNDYEGLKIELKARNLPTGGDKVEMIIRVLLHIIDPSMTFDQKTGLETNLQYISKEDVASGNVTVVPIADRPRLGMREDPDADDLIVLKNSQALYLNRIRKKD